MPLDQLDAQSARHDHRVHTMCTVVAEYPTPDSVVQR
jgi:hypothetical protein